MRTLLIIIFFSTFSGLYAQEINKSLKAQLDSIHYKDQALRIISQPGATQSLKEKVLTELGYSEDEFDKEPWKIMSYQDSVNLIKIKDIIKNYGYPGKSLVGDSSSKTAWLVLHHSNEIENYYPLIKEAGEKKELPMDCVAMSEDRILMYKGLEQIYGSQTNGKIIKNNDTGKYEWVIFIWPIKDPDHVNERRKAIGFKTTIEEYSKILGVEYKIISLEEAKKSYQE